MSRVELESSLEEWCVQYVERYGGLALKLQMPGVRGFPDRTIMWQQRIFFVEFKRSKGGRISTQQKRWIERLRKHGHNVYVIDNEEDFKNALHEGINA